MYTTLRNMIVVAGLIAPGLVSGKLAKEEKNAYEPMQVIRTIEVSYPQRLIREFVDQGEADIVVLISDEGRLMDWMVMGYTHPLFVKEVIRILGSLRGRGLALLIAEQNIGFLEVATRVFVLEGGRIRFSGTVAEMTDNEALRRAYFGLK